MIKDSKQEPQDGEDLSPVKRDDKQGDTESKVRKKNACTQFLLEIVSLLFWLYAITKLFVFDFDVYLTRRFFPGNAWIVDYKLLLILGALSVIWIFTRSSALAQSTVYVLLYPIIVCVWKIPKILVKRHSWIGAFVLIGILLSFFRNLKFNVIMSFAGLSTLFIIWKSQNTVMLSLACIVLFLLLVVLYVIGLYVSFRPSLLFQIQTQVVEWFWKSARSIFVPSDELKNVSVQKMSESQLQDWSNSLQFAVILNHTCYFLTTKLRDFQRSKVNVLYYILNFFVLVVITVIIFAAIFTGLYKVDQGQFEVSSPKKCLQRL